MTTLTRIYHEKNEFLEVEFFADKDCTKAFDFTNKDLYIELKDGDYTPLFSIKEISCFAKIYIPYLPQEVKESADIVYGNGHIFTINNITPNLSKYIPEDNAVLFLSEEDRIKFVSNDNIFNNSFDLDSFYKVAKLLNNPPKKLTIFLPHGTQSELQKANKVAKELMEKYGVEEVNLFVLYWFDNKYEVNNFEVEYLCKSCGILSNINKIVATNSTGILEPQNSEHLQVVDSFDIFGEHLNQK